MVSWVTEALISLHSFYFHKFPIVFNASDFFTENTTQCKSRFEKLPAMTYNGKSTVLLGLK